MRAMKPELDDTGKILLPPSALGAISTLDLVYPLQFKIQSKSQPGQLIFAGVLEFTANEGQCVLPSWMMDNIAVKMNDFVIVEYVTIPLATFVQLQPQSVDFLDISNPKAVLESKFRGYSALTLNSIISLHYNNKVYRLKVLDLKPSNPLNAVSIVEADVKVDFAAPVGYVEPAENKSQKTVPSPSVAHEDLDPSQVVAEEESEEEQASFKAFAGTGASISGRPDGKSLSSKLSAKEPEVHKDVKDKVVIGPTGELTRTTESELEKLRRERSERFEQQKQRDAAVPKGKGNDSESASNFKAFSGTGYRMK